MVIQKGSNTQTKTTDTYTVYKLRHLNIKQFVYFGVTVEDTV